MKKNILTLLLMKLLCCNLFAQPYTTFIARLDGNQRIRIKETTYGADGSAYAIGTFTGQVNFNGNVINSVNGEYDPFIAKIDSLGNWLWFVPVQETSPSGSAYDVAVDTQNNVYVVGTCDSGATALGTQIENGIYGVGPYNGLFLLKITQIGNSQTVSWFKGSSVTTLVNYEKSAGIAIDNQNNIIISAVHNSSGNYTPSFAGLAFDNNTADQAFVCKLNSAGVVVKKWETAGDHFMNVNDLVIDKFGNILFTAIYRSDDGTCALEPGNIIINSFNRSTYGAPIIIKLSDSLTTIWAKAEWTQYQQSFLFSLATDTIGNAFVISTYTDSVKIANNYFYANAGYLKQAILYSYKADGTFNFIKKFTNSNTGDVEIRNLACDKDNKMVMSADIYGTVATFGGIGINSRSFIARINSLNGNLISSRIAINQNITTPALAVSKNKILLGGANQANVGPLQFNNSSLSLPDFSSASELGYLAQFNDTIFLTTINENYFTNSTINIFPNPAHDKVFLSCENLLEEKCQMIVYNGIGAKVKVDNFNSIATQTIDLSSLKNGVYFIEVIAGNKIFKKSFYILN
jgi:hypothetical protein